MNHISLVLIFASTLSPSASLQAQPEEFDPRVVLRRPMPAITDAPVVSAHEAGEVLNDAELVLGVEVNGKARAYPIRMLTGHPQSTYWQAE